MYEHFYCVTLSYSAVYAVIMCLSVCLSQVRVLQRWLNLGSQKQRNTIHGLSEKLQRDNPHGGIK